MDVFVEPRVRARPDTAMTVSVDRDGLTQQLLVTPKRSLRNGEEIGTVGMAVMPRDSPERIRTPGAALWKHWVQR